MPNSATMSVYGLMAHDPDLFDNLVLPASVDGQKVVDNIILECSELEVLYPDWDFMQTAIGIWSNTELPTWEKIAALSELQYNPIENYDRHETETTGRDRNLDRKRTTSESETASGATSGEQASTEKTSGSDDSVSSSAHNVTGYNTNTPVTDNTDQSVASGSRSGSTDGNVKNSQVSNSETSRDGTDNTLEGEQENVARTSHIHGNIGVTTVAQMMAGELEISPKINIINYITDSFKRRFCVMVY